MATGAPAASPIVRWQDTAGNVRTQLGGQFIAPGPGAFLMLTAVRHWVSSSVVEVHRDVHAWTARSTRRPSTRRLGWSRG
jgi:hypothetical protein